MIRGDLAISFGGTELAAVRSASIEASLELVSGAIDSGWTTSAPRLINWSANGDMLQKIESGERVSSQKSLEEHVFDKTRLSMTLTTPYGAVYTGSAYVTQWDVQASFGNAMSGSFTFQGAGALTLTE